MVVISLVRIYDLRVRETIKSFVLLFDNNREIVDYLVLVFRKEETNDQVFLVTG